MLKDRPGNRLRGYLGIIIVTLAAGLFLKTFVIGAFCVPSASMESTLIPGDYIFINKLIYGAKLPNHLPFSTAAFSSFRLPSLKKISRGDVIVFELPKVDSLNPDPTYFVKRCVGLAGDSVIIRDGNIFINGNIIRFPSIGQINKDNQFGSVVVPQKGSVVTITQKNYFMMEQLIRMENHSIRRLSDSTVIIDGKPTKIYTVLNNYLFVLGDNINHSSDSRVWGFLPEENVIGQAMVVYWSAINEKYSSVPSTLFSSIRWSRIGTFIN